MALPLSDTSPEIEAAQLERYRAMSAGRKLELVEDANTTARILALTGLAARQLTPSIPRVCAWPFG